MSQKGLSVTVSHIKCCANSMASHLIYLDVKIDLVLFLNKFKIYLNKFRKKNVASFSMNSTSLAMLVILLDKFEIRYAR